jgi:hypothetical protein
MKMRKPWKACSKKVRRSIHVRSLPGMGPILAAVVVTEIDGIEALPLGSEALWLRRLVSLYPQQRGLESPESD